MKLQIKDFQGKPVMLYPWVKLYSVQDALGKEKLPGLAVVLNEENPETGELEQYAVLTVSFGEFISIKNAAYIDTNNCYFAEQLLDSGIAEPTALYKNSGYCRYPLWIFTEDFLNEIGGKPYQIYSESFDEYMKPLLASEEDEGMVMS